MTERASQLVELFGIVLHGDQESINKATKLIKEACCQVETINDLLLICSSCENPIIRRFSSIMLRQMINKLDFDNDQILIIKNGLLSAINNDPDVFNKRSYADAAVALQSKLANLWDELYSTATNYISNCTDAALFIFGLYLWTEIVELTPEIILLNYFGNLMQIVVSNLNNQNKEIRINTIDLFSALTNRVDLGLFSEYPNLIELFLCEIRAISEGKIDVDEANTSYICISNQLRKENPIFLNSASQFVDIALNLTMSGAPIEIKESCQILMAVAPMVLPDLFSEQFPIFLQAIFTLAVQICSDNRKSPNIGFLADFIDSIIANTDCLPDVVTALINKAHSSKNDPCSFQVSLFALSATVDQGSEDFFEGDNSIDEIVLFALGHQDPFVFDASCGFLLAAASQAPELYQQKYNEIIYLLFNRLQEPRAMQTLDCVIYNSEQTPVGYLQLLAALASLLNNARTEQYESIISCMTSVISHIDEVKNEVYESMRSILVQLLSSDNQTLAKVFECFGQLAKVAPIGVQSDAPQILEVLFKSLNTNDDNLNESIANCVQNIVKIIPMSIQPFLQSIVPAFLTLLTKDGEKKSNEANDAFRDESDDEDFDIMDTFVKTQCSALIAIAELISDLPNDMLSSIEGVVNAVCHFLEDENEMLQKDAAKSILLMNDGLKAVSFDISYLLGIVIDRIYKSPDIEVISELFAALGSLLGNMNPNSIGQDQLKAIMQLYQDTFEGKLDTVYSNPKILNPQICNKLFFSLRMLIFTLGNNIQGMAHQFIGFLRPHMNVKKLLIKAFATSTYGAIFLACPSLKEIGSIARDSCLKNMTKRNDIVNNLLISTLNFCVHADKSILSKQQVTTIKRQVDSIIAQRDKMDSMIVGSAITLWCSLIASYDLQASERDLNAILSLLPPVVDDDDIPFAAQFICFAMNKWPALVSQHINRISVNIFASGDWCLRIIPREVMLALASVIRAIPNEELQIYVKYNQHYIMQINNNISKFAQ